MITIIDLGMGNLASIKNMLKKIGVNAEISPDAEVIAKAKKIILPGVGAFDNAMTNIDALGLRSILNKKALEEKVPVLGICLGMQILMKSSEEGSLPGLGWIDGVVKRFRFDNANSTLKVPHMGWNLISTQDDQHLFKGLQDSKFYFVHSYYVECSDSSHSLATTTYGIVFTSSVHKDNIFGTQFHPEKSHRYGMQLLRNFATMN
ncbi:MAG: imidazole glycerol phosphate synthase subunit HisH [Bacteroidota bacterium]|jgi:glutamine amidotransferase|nr:MAG: imidazole glycerol phosphate synthase subunit HisH [Bacteroidota bacterium]